MPVHAIVPLRNALGRARRSSVVQLGHELVGARGVHVDDHELLLGRGGRREPLPNASARSATSRSWCPAIRPAARGEPHRDPAVVLREHADVVAQRHRQRRPARVRRAAGPRGTRAPAPRGPLGAPVLHEELQARVVPRAPVAVLAEERRHARPDLGHALGLDERAEPLREHRVRREAAAHLQVVARRPARGADTPTNETSLISWFVQPARQPLIEVLNLRGRFENAGSPTKPLGHRPDGGGRVEHLVARDAGQRAPEDHARGVAAGLLRREAHGLDRVPRSRACPRSGSSAAARSGGR